MSEYKCRGHALRESVMPLVKSGRLFLVLFLFMVCGLALGCAATARQLYDPTPYNRSDIPPISIQVCGGLGRW